MRSFFRLCIETKTDDEEFEVYDPEILVLKVLQYDPKQTYDMKNLTEIPGERVEVNKIKNTTADLEQILSTRFGIPLDQLLMLIKHTSYNNSSRTEVFNMPWRKNKKLEDCKLEQG